jgi:hypothetical protein
MPRPAFALACLASALCAAAPAAGAPSPPPSDAALAAELLDAESTFGIDDPFEPLLDWLSAVGSAAAFGLAAESVRREGLGSASARWLLVGTRVGGVRAITRTFRRPELARACVERADRVRTCVAEAADRGRTLRRVRVAFNGASAFAGALGYGLWGSERMLLPAAASGVAVILDLFPTKSERLARDRLGVASVVPLAAPLPEGGGLVVLAGTF